MSRVCEITGKRTRAGNNVSHAHRKTRRQWLSNLHYHNFWVPSENRFVRLRVSTKGLRLIDKHGIEKVLRQIGKTKGGGGKKQAAPTPEKTLASQVPPLSDTPLPLSDTKETACAKKSN